MKSKEKKDPDNLKVRPNRFKPPKQPKLPRRIELKKPTVRRVDPAVVAKALGAEIADPQLLLPRPAPLGG